jgi:hypothetical protein
MGAKLSAAQIAWYVTDGVKSGGVYGSAGMPITPHNAVIAVAVALAESGGVVDKKSNQPNADGSNDWGLWQINDRAHAVSQEMKTNGGANWAAAYQISDRGTDWTPWTTYRTGAYLAFMAQAQVGVNHPDGSYQNDKEIPNNPASAAAAVASGLLPAALTESSTWVRVGMGVGGVILLGLVAIALVGPSRIAGAVPATRALETIGKAVKR